MDQFYHPQRVLLSSPSTLLPVPRCVIFHCNSIYLPHLSLRKKKQNKNTIGFTKMIKQMIKQKCTQSRDHWRQRWQQAALLVVNPVLCATARKKELGWKLKPRNQY